MKGMGKAIRRYREEAGITQERLAELVDISTNHLGAIEREVKTPTMETFVKLLNVLGAEPNEVLKEVIPLTRMEHTSVVEGKLERLTPKKQESVLRMLDDEIEAVCEIAAGSFFESCICNKTHKNMRFMMKVIARFDIVILKAL